MWHDMALQTGTQLSTDEHLLTPLQYSYVENIAKKKRRWWFYLMRLPVEFILQVWNIRDHCTCWSHVLLLVASFVELVPFVFTIPGVSGFLSNRVNQDPLEKFFGIQRQSGKSSDNPTVAQFVKNSTVCEKHWNNMGHQLHMARWHYR